MILYLQNLKGHMAVYGPVRHQKNIIWTSEASVHPYNIFLVMDRSIYCHMTLSAMNYLLFNISVSSYANKDK
jgi:hypothetical protein